MGVVPMRMRAALAALALALAGPAHAFEATYGPSNFIAPTGLPVYGLAAFMADRRDVKMQATPATCDGTTDDTTALNAATFPALLPITPCALVGAITTLTSGRWYSTEGGYLKPSEGKQSPNFSAIISAPTQTGSTNSFTTAYNADWTKVHLPFQIYVAGSTTLGQPASGYTLNPLVAGIYGTMFTQTGWNQNTGSNDGRTGVAAVFIKVFQSGQGDAGSYYATTVNNGVLKGSATSFLANPASFMFAGQATASKALVYVQGVGDINISDGGFDIAAVAFVTNMTRTVGTGAINSTWIAYRSQSIGAIATDAAFSHQGPTYIGLDVVGATFQDRAGTSSKAAVAMKANDRIYANATNSDTAKYPQNVALGTEWHEYDATLGHSFVVASASVFSVNATAVTTSKPVKTPQITSTGTQFTISGCTTSSLRGGATAGDFVSGTTGACTPVVTLGGQTAPTGWACTVSNRTTANLMRQSASSTTTATFTGTTVTNDVLSFNCVAY